MSNTWVDFAAIKATVTLELVLERYGLLNGLQKKGTERVGPCPVHQGQGRRTFHANLERHCWRCFSCGAKGNVLDLVAALESCDIRQAALLLAEWFHVEHGPQPARARTRTAAPKAVDGSQTLAVGGRDGGGRPKPERASAAPAGAAVAIPAAGLNSSDAPINPPLTFALKTLDPTHPYLAERALTPETIAYFGLGYASRGMMKGRIAIPLHDQAGQLVGYIGRAVTDDLAEAEGKYKLPPGLVKSAILYNLHRAAPLARERGLVVVEGLFGTFHLHQAGVPNVVALLGKELSEVQEALLLEAIGPGGRVALMLDRDDAGREATRTILRRLLPKVYVRVVPYPTAQPDALTAEQLRELFP